MDLFRDRRFLVILAIAAAIRCGALWSPGAFKDDPDDYLRFAQNLVKHGTYGPNPGQPSAFRSPGYPLLLAALVKLTHRSELVDLWAFVFALHIVATIGLVVGTVRLAGRFGSLNTSLLAGLLVAVDPLLVRQSVAVMSETAFVTSLVWLLNFWLAGQTKPKFWNCIDVGITLAVAALIRPIAIPVWLAIGAASLFAGRWRLWFLSSLVAAVVYSPWPIRNRIWSGSWIATTTHGGYTLWLGQNPEFHRYEVVEGKSWPEESFKKWSMENDKATIHLSEVDRDAAFRSMALRWMADHPAEAARASLWHALWFWRVVPRRTEASVLLLAATAVFGFTVMAAAAFGLRNRVFWNWPGVALPLTLLTFTAVHAFYWSNIRMRAPLEPILAVLAAMDLAAARAEKGAASDD